MTRRDARIMARRLRGHPDVTLAAAECWDHGDRRGWVVSLRIYWPGTARMLRHSTVGAGVLYRPPRGHAAVLAWLGLSP